MKKVILATVFTALLLGGCSSGNVANEQPPADSSSSTATSSSTVESTVESSAAEVDTSNLSYFYPLNLHFKCNT
jgi:PBP1b-binding outer membrane lipoprotein LpoB